MSSLRDTMGPVAVVTGASDGIGLALARDLAREGLGLLLVARRQGRLEAIAEEIRAAHGVPVEVLAADLATTPGLAAVTEAAERHDVGLAVLAAGYGTSGPLATADLAAETDMLDVNCRAVLVLCHAFARRLSARGRGGIVLLSSLVAFQGNGATAHYSATKAYVQSLAEGLGQELAPRGVRVLAVAPGPVASGFASRAGLVLGPTATPEVIARGTLRALASGGTVRPGLLSKLLGWGTGLLPRPVRVRLMTRTMAGFVQPGAAPSRQEA